MTTGREYFEPMADSPAQVRSPRRRCHGSRRIGVLRGIVMSCLVPVVPACVPACDADPGDPVDRTAEVVVRLPRAGDTLAAVETIDGTGTDTMWVDAGDHVWDSIFYLDSNVCKAPPSRARRGVAVTIRSRMGADMLALEPLNDSLRVLRVGDTEVMSPDGLVRAEQWGGAAIDRPFRLSVDLPRCDSVDVAVVETWLSGNENWSWVLGNLAGLGADTSRLASVTIRSHPTQSDTLPGCCERTLRRRAAMTQTGGRSASREEGR